MSTTGLTSGYGLIAAVTGAPSMAALIQGQDGNFYGTAIYGGTNVYGVQSFGFPGYGTVFKVTPKGAVTAAGNFNFDDGAYPQSPLIQTVDGNLLGTASGGGTNGGFGTIFKMTPAGAITGLFSFANTNGADPVAGLTLDTDGSLYGTTLAGGLSNCGTVFRLAPDGTFNPLYSFSGGNDGSNCYGGLLLASDGNFYGTTEGGGTYGFGTVFRVSREGALTTLANFDGYQGAVPECTLIQATDGNLYGTAQFGGANNYGAIFRLSFAGPLQITEQPRSQEAFAGQTVSFSVATAGALPMTYQWLKNGTNLVDGGNVAGSDARVLTLTNVAAADGATYLVVVSTSYGPISSAGAALQVTGAAPVIVVQPQSQTVLEGAATALSVQASGSAPLYYQWQQNGLDLTDGGGVSGSATSLLAMAPAALSNAGTFTVEITNSLGAITSSPVTLAVLAPSGPSSSLSGFYLLSETSGGSFNPYAGVIQGVDGNFYGTTLHGGAAGLGSIFTVSTLGPVTGAVMYSFTNGADGSAPLAGLVQASDGNFYGASSQGAGSSFGALFKMTPGGALTVLHSFAGAVDGGNPAGSLVQGADGSLYGTASTGGSNGLGTLFRITTNGVFTSLWSFQPSDGSYPAGPLLQIAQGNFLGTTVMGGSNNLGTIFSLSTNGAVVFLASFDSAQGAYPSNGLAQAADGNFYGTASGGGSNGLGTVFRLTPNGSLTALHSFNNQDGAVPVGGLTAGMDGNLYGTTSQAGVGGQGTVFQITTNGLLTTLFWFNGPNGANPQAALIQASDGLFYGTTEFGGSHYDGANSSGDGWVFRLASDPLVITPSSGFDAVGQPAGPFAPAGQTYVLSNASPSSLVWSVINPAASWLIAAPTSGILAPGAITNVKAGFSAAANLLGNGTFATSLVFTNWSTHVSQIDLIALQIGSSIVQNGGFETGSFADSRFVGDTVEGTTFYDLVTNNESGLDVVHSGNFGVYLGDDQLATLSQTLPTMAGQTYLLSFWLDNPESGSGQQFEVKWQGATLYNKPSPSAFAWTNFQFLVTADSASTVLQFAAENSANYFGFDDVSVTPIPAAAFLNEVQTSNAFNLSWMTATGISYQLQYKTNLLQSQWVNLGATSIGTGYPATASDTNAVQLSSERFYRLVAYP
jgi:uncharacterized repeat protein (TIGR03803 family)